MIIAVLFVVAVFVFDSKYYHIEKSIASFHAKIVKVFDFFFTIHTTTVHTYKLAACHLLTRKHAQNGFDVPHSAM